MGVIEKFRAVQQTPETMRKIAMIGSIALAISVVALIVSIIAEKGVRRAN